jgi:iron(III) transport system substrate-binding protein
MLMSCAKVRFLGLLATMALVMGAVRVEAAPDTWQQTLDKAKTQTLIINNQGNPAFDAAIAAFTKKFGIPVESTVTRPSMAITRLQTEQRNGRYLADIWWAITGLMTTVAAPAGMFAPFEDYLILPEVKDISNWRHPDYIYGDDKRTVFTYNHEVNLAVYRNHDVLPDVNVDSYESLMDPRLKGKIVIRDASYPNAGSYALAPLYKARGADFLAKFLKQQDPRVFENPQQLETAFTRGGYALAIGEQSSLFSLCRADGGCQHIEKMDHFASAASRGFAVLKNPPHPEATTIFLNWILSKEGQELLVREWAKANTTGAVSMRKDVAPAPGQEQDLPDFSDPGQYVWVSTQQGDEEVSAVVKIFKEWSGK